MNKEGLEPNSVLPRFRGGSGTLQRLLYGTFMTSTSMISDLPRPIDLHTIRLLML
jgi:hypothetical protein